MNEHLGPLQEAFPLPTMLTPVNVGESTPLSMALSLGSSQTTLLDLSPPFSNRQSFSPPLSVHGSTISLDREDFVLGEEESDMHALKEQMDLLESDSDFGGFGEHICCLLKCSILQQIERGIWAREKENCNTLSKRSCFQTDGCSGKNGQRKTRHRVEHSMGTNTGD
jgi:hypothetical protein